MQTTTSSQQQTWLNMLSAMITQMAEYRKIFDKIYGEKSKSPEQTLSHEIKNIEYVR